MKDTKVVYATTYERDRKLNCEYDWFANRKVTIDSSIESNEKTKEFGCQYDKNSICTCKRIRRKEIRYYTSSRQVYRSQRYSSARGFTDIGVGNVKILPKKRVRRIYLPETIETGVGSSDLTPLFGKTTNWGASYYDQKKTSSKCIGGVMDCTNISVVSEKLSPIIRTTSGSNSPKVTSNENIIKASILVNNEATCSKTEDIQTPTPRDSIISKKQIEVSENKANFKKSNEILTATVNQTKSITTKANIDEKDFSSDSLIQHVHNLENPSDYKQSRMSMDFIETKLEREYRKIFTSKPKERKPTDDKILPDFKSASTLRKRFEALRRGINKKDETKTDLVTVKVSSRVSVPSKKDVSIVSDPPSLEARSYSNTKAFSPLPSIISTSKKNKVVPYTKISTRKSFTAKKVLSPNWSTDVVDSDCQGVKGMFKLWGKKFNLEEDNYDKMSPLCSGNITEDKVKKVDIVAPTEEGINKKKKEGKIFSFFKKRSKDKSKKSYKSGKGVTAGRCEVEGLMIKIGAANEYPPEPPLKTSHRTPDEFNDILRKAWLKKFLSTKVDSKHSAQIRWNNNMYRTSSTTVFELIDCVYKNTGIIFRSKSEMTTGESSFYQSFITPQVNFMHQSIQAWMVPKTTRDNQMVPFNIKKESKNIEVTYSNQKWFIEKSKAFAHKIEVVLHSNNLVKQDDDDSSDYIMIDIPKGYFSDTSSIDEDISQTSDEQVFNIVEYETGYSNSYIKQQKQDSKMETGDHASNEIQVTVSIKDSKNNESNILETVIKRPPLQRDVVLQGSNVYVPKRCDVIGVGIITHRDIRDIKKPILKIQDELTDDSEHILPPQKKCEFAESYLQDYYKHWIPLGIDLFSWCVSDSHLRGSSENNSLNSLNQGDGSKSCPNIYDDYQASTIISSCNTSSCSRCINLENEKVADEQKKQTLFGKLRKKPDSPSSDTRRVLPKDSLEVYKRRKIYALSNKALWATMDSTLEPYCVPSIEDKCEQKSSNGCPLQVKNQKKRNSKHVSMQNCDVLNDLLEEQLSDKCIEGILSFKGIGGRENCKKSDTPVKHARVIPKSTAAIAEHPSIDSCTKKRKSPCSKKNSSSCYKPAPPVCPVHGSCQEPCPPIAPPNEGGSAHALCPISPRPPSKPSPTKMCPKSSENRPRSNTHFQPPPSPKHSCPACATVIPPKVHSPPSTDPSQKPCACLPKESTNSTTNNFYEGPIEKRSHLSPIIKYGPCKYSAPTLTPPCTSPLSRKDSTCSSPPQPVSPSRDPPCSQTPGSSSSQPSGSSSPRPLSSPHPPCSQTPDSPPSQPPSSSSSQPLCSRCPPCSPPSKKTSTKCQTESPEIELKCKTCASQEFPWPLKNQMSNTSSKELGLSIKISPQTCPEKKISSKFSDGIKDLFQKPSSSSIKDCKPDCANRHKVINCPPVQPTKEPRVCRSRSKMPGLHLKMIRMPKCPSKQCLSMGDDNEDVIRLNSQEKITIKLRQATASTEEIREGCNMRVQDEDGKTLCERRNYQKKCNRTPLLKDMFSQIHRVATSSGNMMGENMSEYNITTSIPNIIEINLSLKFKQGDKTKISVNKCNERQKNVQELTNPQHESSKEVYLIQDQPKPLNNKTEKKDLDIKIVIKNYKQQPLRSQQINNHCLNIAANDNLSKKISGQFHTVSTGYSEDSDQKAFSTHRTTIDLTNSIENNKVQGDSSNVIIIEQVIKKTSVSNVHSEGPINKPSGTLNTTSSVIIEHLKHYDEISFTSKTNSIIGIKVNSEKTDETNDERSETGLSISDMSDVKHESNDNILPKVHKREEKKAVLKQIFENADNIKNKGDKSKMQNIRKMLRAVLTSDSSAHEDIDVNNELANELTYASLKPNYFKNTESMTNYYLHDSSISLDKGSRTDFEDVLYPTEDNNSECSDESIKNKDSACLCRQFAAKLNIQQNKTGCCCRSEMNDKEIMCDIIDENYYKCKTEFVDVETQGSKYLGEIKRNVTNQSVITNEKELDKVTKTKFNNLKIFSPFSNTIKACQMKRINRSTILGLSDDDKVVILNSNTKLSISKCLKSKGMKPADILQLQETKKAVLEIYAEKTKSKDGERIVAKLPKFVYNKESEIRHYQEMLTGYLKHNIIMMSITQ